MTRNVGRLDRAVRLILGVMVLGLYGALDPPLKYFTLLGLVLVATALSGFCPIYTLFGIRTGKQTE
jgi:hypothetical protein